MNSILHNKVLLAEQALGKSVINIKNTIDYKNSKDLLTYGVKNTNQIPKNYIDLLENKENYQWLTIDKASLKGRAIDVDLSNPITYRLMTGSTSGGPINILNGINNFAIGTDGGGSVLAPALSSQLPSMIGSGLNMYSENKKSSTDGISFTSSIGVIAKHLSVLKDVFETLLKDSLKIYEKKLEPIKTIIPKKNSVLLPNGFDMYSQVKKYLPVEFSKEYKLQEMDMHGIEDRKKGLEIIYKAFEIHEADLIITFEGPVDLYGYGETIPQAFGETGRELTENHGKYLIRSANMAETTAITIPVMELSAGIVIIAKKGVHTARLAVQLAEKIEKEVHVPKIWERYFLSNQSYDGLKYENE